MKFLCLCHYDVERFKQFTPADFRKMQAICEPQDKALRDSGKLVAVGSLGMPDSFRSVRVRQGQPLAIEDAPYQPTPEPFGAFFIIEAADMEEATRIARLHPSTHLGELCDGGIEMRPIEVLDLTAAPQRA